MHRLAAALAVLCVALAPLPVAQAQIGPNVPAPLTEPPPPPPAPTKFDDGGLSTLQQVLIFGAAALVLALIAFVIVRDARRAAPADDHPRGSSSGPSGATGAARSARERERQQRAKRQKAKAARRQRKRNRPH
jgi:hypothetical protein